MGISELLPILQNLSDAEKLRILEFLQADLDRPQSPPSTDVGESRLRRKENLLVIETGSLAHIDFSLFR